MYGKIQESGLLKLLLAYAPQLSRARILLFPNLDPLRVPWGGYSSWWLDGCNILCFLIWQVSFYSKIHVKSINRRNWTGISWFFSKPPFPFSTLFFPSIHLWLISFSTYFFPFIFPTFFLVLVSFRFFVCLLACFFLGLHLWHMKGSSQARVKLLEQQLLAYTTATAMQDLSRVCDLYHRSQQCRIPNPGIKPTSSWVLVRFIYTAPQW